MPQRWRLFHCSRNPGSGNAVSAQDTNPIDHLEKLVSPLFPVGPINLTRCPAGLISSIVRSPIKSWLNRRRTPHNPWDVSARLLLAVPDICNRRVTVDRSAISIRVSTQHHCALTSGEDTSTRRVTSKQWPNHICIRLGRGAKAHRNP